MASSATALTILMMGVGASAAIDLRTRRVPNALTLTLATVGVASAGLGLGGISLRASFIGMVMGLALMLPGYLFGATGAGDVKLFAAIGTVLGPSDTLTAFWYTAIAGGILALYVAHRRRRLAATVRDTTELITSGGGNATEIESAQRDNRFAYAPAIAAGSMLAALGW